jgi:tetratricopeptide (TPR) repeat protein
VLLPLLSHCSQWELRTCIIAAGREKYAGGDIAAATVSAPAGFAASLAAAGVIIFAAGKIGVADMLNRSSDPRNWLRAAQIEPRYGEYWRHLGRYRQHDLDNADPLPAVEYYQKAVRVDPRSSRDWMDLGASFEQNNQPELANQAFQRAVADYPLSAEVKWNYGNFLLRGQQISAGARCGITL